MTFGHGRVTRTVGIPGTGIFYTHTDGRHTGVHSTGWSWLWLVVIALIIIAIVNSQ